MRRILRGVFLAVPCPALAGAQNNAALDRAFEVFWNAGSSKAAEKAAAGILATGAPFAEVHERLAAGRRYTAGAALMGLIGGLLPALRAARMPITRALRDA